jgi:hypothetical protein
MDINAFATLDFMVLEINALNAINLVENVQDLNKEVVLLAQMLVIPFQMEFAQENNLAQLDYIYKDLLVNLVHLIAQNAVHNRNALLASKDFKFKRFKEMFHSALKFVVMEKDFN